MPGLLEGEAEDEDGDGHRWGGEPDDDEARFGLDVSVVAGDVEAADGVVEPVAEDGAENGADYGGEVEEAWRWGWVSKGKEKGREERGVPRL